MISKLIKFFKRPERLPIHIHQSTYPLSEFEICQRDFKQRVIVALRKFIYNYIS